MTEQELDHFISNMGSEERKQKLIELIHHHIHEIKKVYEMLEDVNEDKKAFRCMVLKNK